MAPKKDKGKEKAKSSPLRYRRPDDDSDTEIVNPHLPTLDPTMRWYVSLFNIFIFNINCNFKTYNFPK